MVLFGVCWLRRSVLHGQSVALMPSVEYVQSIMAVSWSVSTVGHVQVATAGCSLTTCTERWQQMQNPVGILLVAVECSWSGCLLWC